MILRVLAAPLSPARELRPLVSDTSGHQGLNRAQGGRWSPSQNRRTPRGGSPPPQGHSRQFHFCQGSPAARRVLCPSWGVVEVYLGPRARTQRQSQTPPGRSPSSGGEASSLVSGTSQSPDSGSAIICSLLWPLAAAPTRPAPQGQASPVITHLWYSCVLCSHGGDQGSTPSTDRLCAGTDVPRFPSGASPEEEASFIRISEIGQSKPMHSPEEGRLVQERSRCEARPAAITGRGELSPPCPRPHRGPVNALNRAGGHGSAPLRSVRPSTGRQSLIPRGLQPAGESLGGPRQPPRGAFLCGPGDSRAPRPPLGPQLGISPTGGPLQGAPQGRGGGLDRPGAPPA
ncbi:hypothetical protein NDU88_011269 [Pleurodeles waltl]|uniref:Uncharacterized protein n=1 Tax=Pleurodeles waltl TaxID=8319 RepID=A0AAV7QZX1_PLEWA|nr:hypothetical protein NDU88_011269 [Pleurodeles waltl]